MKFLALLASFTATAIAGWIPGILPRNYEKGQYLDIYTSPLQTLSSSFKFDFYSVNWCQSTKGRSYDPSTSLEKTNGELIESPFQHKFGFDRNVQICKKTLEHN